MEDLSKSQIARLVLGYLKNENMQAHNYFYKQSKYFDKFRQRNIKICTRLNGLTLEDILIQYREISSMVQARLEDTDYYDNRSHHFMELPQQLVFLLDDQSFQCHQSQSCSSTPLASIQGDEGNLLESNLSSIGKDNEKNKDKTEKGLVLGLDVNATPLQTLPGNSIDADANTPRNRNDTETERSEIESSCGENEPNRSQCIEDAVEAFRDSLLADENLQERIASTINEVQTANQAGDAVDSAIEAIMNKTHSDPAFETIFQEILGTAPQISEKMTNHPNQENMIVIDSTGHVNPSIIVNTNRQVRSTPLTATVSTLTDPHKPIFFISTPQIISQQEATNVTAVNVNVNGITEQDILSMPVYVCTEKLEERTVVEPPPSQSHNQSYQIPKKRLKTLLPKRPQTQEPRAQTLSDYITLYRDTTDDSAVCNIINQPSTSGVSTVVQTVVQVDQQTETQTSVPQADKGDKDSRTPEQPQNKVVAPTPTTRSGNRSSHVRALDFKFQTPAKDLTFTKSTSPQTYSYNKGKKNANAVQKSVKTLFNPPHEKQANIGKSAAEPWDMKFRTLISSETAFSVRKQQIEPKSPKEVSNENQKDTKIEEMNTISSPNENIDSTNSENVSQVNSRIDSDKGEKPKKKSLPRKAKKTPAKTPSKVNKTVKMNETTPVNAKPLKSKLQSQSQAETSDKDKDKSKDSKEEHNGKEEEKEKAKEEINCITLININKPPNYKTKCNVDRGDKREKTVPVPVVASNTRNKSSDRDKHKDTHREKTAEKHVLSPSKLNGNKRSIVVDNDYEVHNLLSLPSLETPETCEPSIRPSIIPPSTAKRNIIPILQTPGKEIQAFVPKTPNLCSPANINDTPFTKVFKEQMDGIDINSIPTPKMLLTPSFPFTPLMDAQSGECNRPTDYSTSSSYYQPSDTEQNKSLDTLIEECDRLEKQKEKEAQGKGKQDRKQEALTGDAADAAVAEKMKKMNSNTVARKNLSLIKNKDANSSSSASCSSNSSSSSSTEEYEQDEECGQDVEWECERNDTDVQNSKDGVSRYSLRSKSIPPINPSTGNTVAESATKEINEILNNFDYVPKLNKARKDTQSQTKSHLLTDLELKRQRMIAVIKNESNDPFKDTEKLQEKSKKGKPQIQKKKSTSPKANTKRVLRSNSAQGRKSKEDDLHLHLTSSDDEDDGKVRPFEVVEAELRFSESNTPALDTEQLGKSGNTPMEEQQGQKGRGGVRYRLSEEITIIPLGPKGPGVLSSEEISEKQRVVTSAKGEKNSKKTAQKPSKTRKIIEKQEKSVDKPVNNKEKADKKSSSKSKINTPPSDKNSKGLKTSEKTAKDVDKCEKEPVKKASKTPKNTTKSKTTKPETKPKTDKEKSKEKENPETIKVDLKFKSKEIETSSERPVEKVETETFATNTVLIPPGPPDFDPLLKDVPQTQTIPPPEKEKASVKKPSKGTTGPDAVKLVVALFERGIHLVQNPEAETCETHNLPETECSLKDLQQLPEELIQINSSPIHIIDDDADNEPINLTTTKSVSKGIFLPSTKNDKIGRCITTVGTPEDDLIYFDIFSYTETEAVFSTTSEETQNTRDFTDDKIRCSKSFSVCAYDDETDTEIEKVLTVTEFDSIFEYPAPSYSVKKTTIKVLENVVVKKKRRPLQALYEKLVNDICSDNESTNEQEHDILVTGMGTNSPLEDLYGIEPSKSSRFMKARGSCNSDKEKKESGEETEREGKRKFDNDGQSDETATKKVKIDANDQRLLKDVDVDHLLAKLHG